MNQTTSAPSPDSPEYFDWLYREDPELDRSDRAYFRNGYVDRSSVYRGDEDCQEWGY